MSLIHAVRAELAHLEAKLKAALPSQHHESVSSALTQTRINLSTVAPDEQAQPELPLDHTGSAGAQTVPTSSTPLVQDVHPGVDVHS
jgi:hypothetical protein